MAITNTVILVYAVVKSAMSVMDNAPMLEWQLGHYGQVGMIGNALKGSVQMSYEIPKLEV